MYDTSYTDPDPDPPDTGTTSWDHWDHWPGLSRETITRIEFYCDLWAIELRQAVSYFADICSAFHGPIEEVIQRLQDFIERYNDALGISFTPNPTRKQYLSGSRLLTRRQLYRQTCRTYPSYRNLLPPHRHNPATVPKLSVPLR